MAVDLDGPFAVIGASLGGLLASWGAYYAVHLQRDERRLVHDVVRATSPGRFLK
jgi:surfactin synthase thioesterase subunit